MSRQRRWLGRTYARSERVVTRKIGSELVLVPLANHGADIDSIFNLQSAAPFIWDLLDETRSGDSIVDAIVKEYDVTRPQAA
ncbi:MAG TPA: PqqD family protein, partial [Myxococcota bacterium]|nr:PqqD family protein [Myxococcota bacterium]